MRKIILYISLVTLIVSCKKKEEDPIGPTIALKSDSGYITSDISITGDTTLNMGVTASLGDGTSFSAVQVFYSYDNANWEMVADCTASGASVDFDYSIAPRNFLGNERWSIVVVDNLGMKASATVGVNTMNIEKSGVQIYDICKETNNAYDLLNDVSASLKLSGGGISDTTDLDMINSFQCDTPMFYGWYASSISNTKFIVLDSNYFYDDLVRQDVIEIFQSGVAQTYSGEVAAGDLYVANLRGGASYAIIQVDKVVVTDTATLTGYIEFSYKK